jgi:hypothetical protein
LDIRPLIAAVPPKTSARGRLEDWIADRLNVPLEYIKDEFRRTKPQPRPAVRSDGETPDLRAVDSQTKSEKALLAMCLAQPHIGRDYLERLERDHFSSEAMREVRDHLASHFGNPLDSLPADNPALSAQITGVVMLAEEASASEEVLQVSFLQLELRRVQRAIGHAAQDGDLERQRALWPTREQLRARIDDLMGQTT